MLVCKAEDTVGGQPLTIEEEFILESHRIKVAIKIARIFCTKLNLGLG